VGAMRFKIGAWNSQMWIAVLNLILSISFWWQGSYVFAGIMGGLTILMMAWILLENAKGEYIFQDDGILRKSAFSRGYVIPYDQIKAAHVNEPFAAINKTKTKLALDVGQKVPHEVNVKDHERFLEELRKHLPNLEIQMIRK